MLFLALAAATLWLTVLVLPWRPWWNGEVLKVCGPPTDDLNDITVLVPARNEASVVERTLTALLDQGPKLKVILVDDHSTDGTAKLAERVGGSRVTVLQSPPLEPEWTGKLWALEHGRSFVETPLVLLLDADIQLKPGTVAELRSQMRRSDARLVSVLAVPHFACLWERLLMPAFVYYFKLLYPFRLANSRFRWIAAAAGGCMLVDSVVLNEMGGFRHIRGAVIDDCALARRIKALGYRTWIGLTHEARSLHGYGGIKGVWNMVARTAFAQLHYSVMLLLLCTLVMGLAYWGPLLALAGHGWVRWAGFAALPGMVLTLIPTLRFYGRSVLWSLFAPLIGTLYLCMTWTSAIRHFLGETTRWKERSYRRLVAP